MRDPGSFRDPTGFVFTHDGRLYRQINAGYEHAFVKLHESGLYDELAREGLLVPHEEVPLRLADAPPAHAVIAPERIAFISYPYEWCFGQLKAAALLTLDIQRRAVARGLVLRDASAYNVQFRGARPIFIDTLSVRTAHPRRALGRLPPVLPALPGAAGARRGRRSVARAIEPRPSRWRPARPRATAVAGAVAAAARAADASGHA